MLNMLHFVPISAKEYITLHMKRNPGENRALLEKGLKDALAYALAGKKCDCGNAIWVIGAVQVGYKCFTCITGETYPDNDYEIDQHIQYVNRTFQKR